MMVPHPNFCQHLKELQYTFRADMLSEDDKVIFVLCLYYSWYQCCCYDTICKRPWCGCGSLSVHWCCTSCLIHCRSMVANSMQRVNCTTKGMTSAVVKHGEVPNNQSNNPIDHLSCFVQIRVFTAQLVPTTTLTHLSFSLSITVVLD